MAAKSPINETPPAVAAGDPSAGPQDPDLTAAGRQPKADAGRSEADGILSPAERLTAERTERRLQRAAAHAAPIPAREPRRNGRRERPAESPNALRLPKGMALRDSVSITLIAVLAAGGVLGAILGALSTPGWVIGLLVAGLTVVVSAVVRRYSPST